MARTAGALAGGEGGYSAHIGTLMEEWWDEWMGGGGGGGGGGGWGGGGNPGWNACERAADDKYQECLRRANGKPDESHRKYLCWLALGTDTAACR